MSISDRLDEMEQDAQSAAECWHVGRSRFNAESNAEAVDGALANGESMLAALRAVLELHQPFEWSFGYGPVISCRYCADNGKAEEVTEWPCPTVRVVQAALGEES